MAPRSDEHPGEHPDKTPGRPGDDCPSETLEITRSARSWPTRIGHYTIQEIIASGGMGTVFKAVQENPRRAVAIKIMSAGVHTASDLRRFEFEAQLLGRLRHPGIAQIYEAGTHSEGGVSVPFFAMEYIPNAKSLLDFCQDKRLGTRERLDLFVRVCEAVHHGHQKGIIHRDLKPGNILVGPNGNPRIIDFGVARATDSDMALTHNQTNIGQLVGTIQYMSPEQCEGDPQDIDIRSDVYSLGVVLYELLCRRLPYEVKQTPIFEATRVIRNQDPVRPSRIDSKLRGDLETIVLKALEKDRDRRYQSAAELGMDVRRFLAGDAISARPASSMYQLRVFARRNRSLLAAASAVTVALLAGVIVSSVLYVRSRTYQLQSTALEARAGGAQNYLQDVIASLGWVVGDEIPVSQLLETFESNIEARFADHPEVEAEVRLNLARSYGFLTMFNSLAEAKEFAIRGEENLNRALAIRRELYGPEDPKTLDTLEEVAEHLGHGFDLERAEALRREVLQIRVDSPKPDIDEIMSARLNLAGVLAKREKLREAEALNGAVLDHYETEYKQAGSDLPPGFYQRAWLRQLTGSYDEALADLLMALEVIRRKEGPDSASETSVLTSLANLYVAMGRLDDAAAIYDESLIVSTDRLGIRSWLIKDHVLTSELPTLLVFWECWCPWCQLFIPPLCAMRTPNDPPLQVIGLTSLNNGMTGRDAESFIDRNGLTFPSAVYDGSVFKKLGLTGWPVVIAVHQGAVVWRGNPSEITPGFLLGLARGSSAG